jgi:hypothetical protein
MRQATSSAVCPFHYDILSHLRPKAMGSVDLGSETVGKNKSFHILIHHRYFVTVIESIRYPF